MTQNVKLFLEKVSSDQKLLEQVQHMSKEEVIHLAKDLGLELTEKDLEEPAQGDVVSEDELACVAGGAKCGCVWAGGGGAGDHQSKCSCYKTGTGTFTDGCQRCFCDAFGGGVNS